MAIEDPEDFYDLDDEDVEPDFDSRWDAEIDAIEREDGDDGYDEGWDDVPEDEILDW